MADKQGRAAAMAFSSGPKYTTNGHHEERVPKPDRMEKDQILKPRLGPEGQPAGLFGKEPRLALSKFRCRLMRGFINESMQSFAEHRWPGLFAFRTRKIRWLVFITAGLQIELNESLHG